MNQHNPVAPRQTPRDPGICSSDLQPALGIQATISSTKSAATTRQQNQISISFQLPPPGSSTKSASASSFTTRQQHQISITFHHQAAAPHQPASSKASSQPAINSTTLPHPHHGSQVCCCLDIL